MRSGIRKRLDDIYTWIENNYRGYNRTKQVKRTLKLMNGGNKKNDSHYKEYLDYWKKYGQKPNKRWLRLYAKDSEDFNPRYVPDNLWFRDIIPYFSNTEFRRPYEDKNMHSTIFTNVDKPRTIVKCMAGLYYDPEGNLITKQEGLELLRKETSAIIKPSVDSGEGRLIQFYDKSKENIDELNKKLEVVGDNFIAQEILTQHEKMKSLNPNTLNTIRVLSLLFKEEVHILSIIARMGSGDSRVDNVSAGGIQVTVNQDGTFSKYGFDKKRNKFAKHPDTKVVFEKFEIPGFDEVINKVKEQHVKLPHFKIVGWDFAIGEKGNPVFIEFNSCPGSNQMTDGPTFGDITEEVLQEVYIDKNFANARN